MRCWNRLPREAVGVPSLGGVQDQAGWGPGQPGLVVGGLACGRGGGLESDDPWVPSKPFYDSMKPLLCTPFCKFLG